jgi:hypothetical protein
MRHRTTTPTRVRHLMLVLAAATAFGTTGGTAVAADDIAIVASKVDPLPLYASPGDAAPAASTAASTLPLDVREVKGDFLRVQVGGRDLWVDSMNVRASRKTAARCGAIASNGAKVAGELGAGSDRCK